MARAERIPLFPLDVVLLPRMSLPLHIFEPRYKLMIRRCLDEKLEFGMVLASKSSVAQIGCTAEIVRTIKEYPDGRMDIMTEGRAVFSLGKVFDDKEYYEGAVEYLADEPSELSQSAEAQLLQLFEQCHALLFGQPWEESEPVEPSTLAYRMAARLPMRLADRQALLELRKEQDRRQSLLEWLRQFQRTLADRERKKQRAGGNGHAFN